MNQHELADFPEVDLEKENDFNGQPQSESCGTPLGASAGEEFGGNALSCELGLNLCR